MAKLKINLKKGTTLAGDKGYINKQKKFKSNKIQLITNKRKNQKKQITDQKTIDILKDRYKVEQTFSHLKRSYKRLDVIHDRKLATYEVFFMMAVTCQFARQIY